MNSFRLYFHCLLPAVVAILVLPSSVVSAQQPAIEGSTTSAAPAAVVPTEMKSAAPAAPAALVQSGSGPSAILEVAPEIPLPHRPYKVSVEVGFDGPETKDPQLRQTITNDIRKGLFRMYGHMWNGKVDASSWMIPASSERLQRLAETDVQLHYEGADVEKVILVSVSVKNGAFEISSREFDVRVQELSPLLTEVTNDEQSVAEIACRLVRDCFRPVLLLTGPSIDKTELDFELQAGALTPPDPTAAQISSGDVLRTFIRQLDRRNPGKVKLLQRLDLCYVRVTTFDRELRGSVIPAEDTDIKVEGSTGDPSAVYTDNGHVSGVLIAHGLVPFGGRGRSMEQIALRQRASAPTSRVKLVLQARPDRPLICFRVDRVSKLRQTDVNEAPGVRLLSDRNGEIEIGVDPANPTFWLYVYSGSVLLARVPYAPGLIPRDTMKLPDDSVRLGVEGELYLLRDQLVDMVAQKAVYMSLAKKAAMEGNVIALEAAIAQLDALPGQKRFEELLNKTKTDAVTRANQQKNSAAKRKVESLCKKMGESLTLFFATDKRVKEAEELEKLRQSAESRAGMAEPATAPSP